MEHRFIRIEDINDTLSGYLRPEFKLPHPFEVNGIIFYSCSFSWTINYRECYLWCEANFGKQSTSEDGVIWFIALGRFFSRDSEHVTKFWLRWQ